MWQLTGLRFRRRGRRQFISGQSLVVAGERALPVGPIRAANSSHFCYLPAQAKIWRNHEGKTYPKYT
jgi:hypothetical protein